MIITKEHYEQLLKMLDDSTKLILDYQKKCNQLEIRLKQMENQRDFLMHCIDTGVDIDFPNSNERGLNTANTGRNSKSNLDF